MNFKAVSKLNLENADGYVLFITAEDDMSAYSFAQAICKQDTKVTEFGHVTNGFMEKDSGVQKLLLIGLGKSTELNATKIKKAAGIAGRALNADTEKKVVLIAPCVQSVAALRALVSGMALGAYNFTECKGKPEKQKSLNVEVYTAVKGAVKVIKEAVLIAENVMWVRDLVNRPGNMVQPAVMAEAAKKVAAANGLGCEILGVKEMRAKKMLSLLAVGQGSSNEPRLIALSYNGAGKDKPFLAIVGKGITFDSGGISIKPSDGMGEMKDDMSGAAAVLGAMKTVAELKLPCNLLAVAACAENMPSGTAQRPGDIVKAANGKTIEVISTDAEGRMVLADAVWYACEKGASKVVDIATLTGAVIIALGNETSGIIANNDELAEDIKEAGQACGENFWQLPALPECKEAIKSDIADLVNSAGRAAGSITGGLFIGEFVKENIPWAHIDMGGTATTTKAKGFWAKGATGFGMETLVELVKR